MKRGLIILLVGLTVSVGAFYLMRERCLCAVNAGATAHDGGSLLPELAWLHHELKLDDAQYAKVQELHLAYRPTCEALCRKMMAAKDKLHAFTAKGDISSPEFLATLQEQATVHLECQKALLNHLHQTASVMSAAQSRQYLDALLPEILGANAAASPQGH